MRIEKLEIENFRCLENIVINFSKDNNLAVIVGVNGVGKTALLDALAKTLNILIIGIQRHENRLSSTQKNKITGFFSNIKNEDITIPFSSLNIISNFKDKDLNLDIEVQVQQKQEQYKVNTNGDFVEYISSLTANTKKNNFKDYPCFAYYKSLRKLNLKLSSKTTIPSIYQLLSYLSCLNINLEDFSDFKTWFEFQENYENERRLRKSDSYRNTNIIAIRKSIENFFSSLLMNHFSDLRIERFERDNGFIPASYKLPESKSNLVINKNDYTLKLEQLSSGEKKLLMLVTDLSRRLIIANPELGENACQGKGIVLIDEIDSHLHPQWQRRVLPALTETFPNCQFIVTTHSPQVLSEVPKESVFILENGKLMDFSPHTKGRDSNSILSEIFGVSERPKWSQSMIDNCLNLMDEEKWEEAKQELAQLSELFGENDTEVVRAQSILHFMED